MIRFDKVPKPDGFEEQVEQRGEAWLRTHPDAERPRDYWSPFKPELAEGFRRLCAYSALHAPVGTVDHFVSWHEDRSQAYDWFNYRFAAGWINSSKQNLESREVLDPFEVEDGWFELLLPSLQLVVSQDIPESHREKAELVLDRLHLRDDERVVRQRRQWYQMYQSGELSLEGLRAMAPLIARAVERAGGRQQR